MKKIFALVSLFATMLAGLLIIPLLSNAQSFPRLITVTTLQPGSALYTMASGVAKVLEQHLSTSIKIQSFTSEQKMLTLVNSGEADLSTTTSYQVWLAYGGVSPHFTEPLSKIRLIANAQVFDQGLLARGGTGIRTLAEIKGKRVTGGYSAVGSCQKLLQAALAIAGLTEKDITLVPVPTPAAGVQAVIEGRADVAGCAATGMGLVSEAEARASAYFLGVDTSPAAIREIKKASAAFYPYFHKAGARPGVKQDLHLVGFDGNLVGGASVPEETMYQIVKMLWDNIEQLQAVHPFLSTWTRDRMATPNILGPYHPGAIRFYKEKGVWTPEIEKAHRALLAR